MQFSKRTLSSFGKQFLRTHQSQYAKYCQFGNKLRLMPLVTVGAPSTSNSGSCISHILRTTPTQWTILSIHVSTWLQQQFFTHKKSATK